MPWQQRGIAEYEAAALWYKERSIQAAENFEIVVNKKIGILRIYPTQYRKTHKEFREIQLGKYPFNIIYLVDEVKMKVRLSFLHYIITKEILKRNIRSSHNYRRYLFFGLHTAYAHKREAAKL